MCSTPPLNTSGSALLSAHIHREQCRNKYELTADRFLDNLLPHISVRSRCLKPNGFVYADEFCGNFRKGGKIGKAPNGQATRLRPQTANPTDQEVQGELWVLSSSCLKECLYGSGFSFCTKEF